jgi:hypothetical protein
MVHQLQEQVAEVENQVMVEPEDQEVVVPVLLQLLQQLEELELQTLVAAVEVVLLVEQIQVLELAVQV